MLAIPEIVNIDTGNHTASATNPVAEIAPEGDSTIASGTQAVAGIGPRIFSSGIPQYRAIGNHPIQTPVTSATTTPTVYPESSSRNEYHVLSASSFQSKTRLCTTAAKWVETNPAAAAKISVEGKYLASTVDQNTFAISHLRYIPSVEGARTAVRLAAAEMKTAGMIRADTDLEQMVERSFISLDGVSDEWLKNLEVEKIAGAQVTPNWLRFQYAKYAKLKNPADVFCGLCLQPAI